MEFLHLKSWSEGAVSTPDNVSACIVDLSSIKLAELEELASSLRSKLSQSQLVAFGPHVHANRLAAAQEAGFDLVLSRGQFSSQIGALAKSWSSD